MKILIINIDSSIPNFALAKIEKYHRESGDQVEYDPMFRDWAEKIYVSCIFTFNRHKLSEWELDPKATIGGSGYSLNVKLPAEIEKVKPKINLGFTSRGCIRNCSFCIVPQKEGTVKAVGDIYDLWDAESREITLLDNNILALPEHFFMICEQLRKENLKVDFNQGLDVRLLTNEIAKELKSIKHKEYRFSFDNINLRNHVENGIELLKRNGINRAHWYVYAEPGGFESAMERLLILKRHGQRTFLMRDSKIHNSADEEKFIKLAFWSNSHAVFASKDFFDFQVWYKHRGVK